MQCGKILLKFMSKQLAKFFVDDVIRELKHIYVDLNHPTFKVFGYQSALNLKIFDNKITTRKTNMIFMDDNDQPIHYQLGGLPIDMRSIL